MASPNPNDEVFASRYCIGRCVPPSFERADSAVDALVALGDRLSDVYGRRVPLMYGSDDALELIYAHRERMQRHFLLMLNEPDIGKATARARWPRRAGRCSSSRASRSTGMARSCASGSSPATPRRASSPTARRSSTTRVVALFREQLTFQEYIPGGEDCLWSFHGLADGQGHVLASFVGRKIRTYPPVDGESSFIELAHDRSLGELGRYVAARMPLKGVFKMDFKRDPRDGRCYLLEINARFNLWHYLGAHNGVNLMRAAYDFLVDGAQWEPDAYSTNRRWPSLGIDFLSYKRLASPGKLSLGAWLSSIVFSRNVYNVFAWSDPAPWLRFQLNRVTRKGHRGYNLLASHLRQWLSTAS